MNKAEERQRIRNAAKAVRQDLRLKIEKDFPGYLEVDDKLHTMVRILTGLRILYSFFYLAMSLLYEMPIGQAAMNLLSPYFFYFWYTCMLRSGKFIAGMMMLFRGGSIVYGGVSTLQMSYWLPYPLIFMVTMAMLMEFVEAVFCIYVLFNSENAHVIRLNRALELQLRMGCVAPETLERMAGYRNECDSENPETEPAESEYQGSEESDSENQEPENQK